MAAISSGTRAISEPKTNRSTIRAPTPPSRTSTSTLGPSLSSSGAIRASNPVIRTGAPATSAPAAASRMASSASEAGSNATASDGGYQTTPKVVRPSSETNRRSPVLAKSAAREPGTAAATAPNALASWSRTPGESTVVPSGSWTTGTSGPETRLPPLPYWA